MKKLLFIFIIQLFLTQSLFSPDINPMCKNHYQCKPDFYCDVENGICKPLEELKEKTGYECFKDSDCPGAFSDCLEGFGDLPNLCGTEIIQ